MRQLVEYIAKALVDSPEEVVVTDVEGEKTTVLELRVAPSDLGKIIGKQGKTARAIRVILNAASTKTRRRTVLEILEQVKGDFTLISSRDHTVSDVIAYVLGCSRRNDPEKNQYFIDETIAALKREYHYFIGYHPQKKAVHIIYRKHLLIGNEQMDRLWQVELAYERNPEDISSSDLKLYQDTMAEMVKEVLTGQKEGLFEAKLIDFDTFLSHVTRMKLKISQ